MPKKSKQSAAGVISMVIHHLDLAGGRSGESWRYR
jgi:hypothetical protein